MDAQIAQTTLQSSIRDKDHVRGSLDAPVTIIEYAEFECPHCGRAFHVIKRVLEEAGDRVRFVFRHFPRDDLHPFSERSAAAAEAAGAQGRFWEMHDFLFERQHQLEYEDLRYHALQLGLDVDRFDREILNGEHAARVHEDVASGEQLGVDKTPTFYFNGVRHEGPYDFDALMAAVADAAGPQSQ
jgi:protein-disulfide isomerase